jgi:hypothetical protein
MSGVLRDKECRMSHRRTATPTLRASAPASVWRSEHIITNYQKDGEQDGVAETDLIKFDYSNVAL